MASKGDLASAILDSASTAIILVNRDLRIKSLNPAAEQMLGVSSLPAGRAQLGRIIQKSSIVLKRVQDDIIAGRSFNQSEVLIVSKSGEHTVDVCVNRFEREGEETLALVEMYEVNGRRRISNEIHQHSQQKAARFLIRELAHEIKNPLSGLRGAAQLLERELNEDQKEYTRIIIEQSDRLKNLVNRLLGPQHAEKKQFISIHEILEKVIKLTGFSLPENIRIKRDYDPSLPEVYVAPEQIYQVFLNIVKNAVEAIGQREDGLITLKTRAAFKVNIRGEVRRLMVEIHVTDNGPGIPDDIKDTVFYPMVSRKEGGHGLGLAIAQTIIDEHDGKIECVSWSGHTDFIISLPVEKTEQDVA